MKQVEENNKLLLKSWNKKLENIAKKPFTIDDLLKKMVIFYTGLQNFEVFQWLYKRVEDKAKRLTYTSQKNETLATKSGPKRKLSS